MLSGCAGLGTALRSAKGSEKKPLQGAWVAGTVTQELVSQLSFWAPTILGMVGGNYEALPKDAGRTRRIAVFPEGSFTRLGGKVPENATLEQATAAYKQAINNLQTGRKPGRPRKRRKSSTLHQKRTVQGGTAGGPPTTGGNCRTSGPNPLRKPGSSQVRPTLPSNKRRKPL
jgi:hypothetical protein